MKTKFDLDEELWYLSGDFVRCSKVIRINIDLREENYGMYKEVLHGMEDFLWINSNRLFRTKIELIKSL